MLTHLLSSRHLTHSAWGTQRNPELGEAEQQVELVPAHILHRVMAFAESRRMEKQLGDLRASPELTAPHWKVCPLFQDELEIPWKGHGLQCWSRRLAQHYLVQTR